MARQREIDIIDTRKCTAEPLRVARSAWRCCLLSSSIGKLTQFIAVLPPKEMMNHRLFYRIPRRCDILISFGMPSRRMKVESTNFADLAPKLVVMATSLERLQNEGHIHDLHHRSTSSENLVKVGQSERS